MDKRERALTWRMTAFASRLASGLGRLTQDKSDTLSFLEIKSRSDSQTFVSPLAEVEMINRDGRLGVAARSALNDPTQVEVDVIGTREVGDVVVRVDGGLVRGLSVVERWGALLRKERDEWVSFILASREPKRRARRTMVNWSEPRMTVTCRMSQGRNSPSLREGKGM